MAAKIAMRYVDPLTVTTSHTYAMIQCFCGDVFKCGGTPEKVEAAQAIWTAQHKDCVEQKREGRKVFWMSFCDPDRPKGSQFLGACLVDVTAEEADAAAIEVMLRFPFAQSDAEWIAAATSKAHRLGCNPGGEIASMEVAGGPSHALALHTVHVDGPRHD